MKYKVHNYIKEKSNNKLNLKVFIFISLLTFILVLIFISQKNSIPPQYQKKFKINAIAKKSQIQGLGKIIADEKLLLAAPDEGVISRVEVRPGQAVQAGQILARITNYQLTQAVQKSEYELLSLQAEVAVSKSDLLIKQSQLQSSLARAQSAEQQQKLELDANERLAKLGIVSAIKFQQSQMAFSLTQLEVAAWQQQLALFNQSYQQQVAALQSKLNLEQDKIDFLKQRVAALTIKAQSSGIVAQGQLDVGQVVKQGQPLFELIDESQLTAQIQVPQYSSEQLLIGQEAIVTTPNGDLRAHVEYIDTVIRNGSVSVFLRFGGELPNWLRADQAVEAIITTDKTLQQFYVEQPQRFNDYQHWVFYEVQENGIAQKREVSYQVSKNQSLLLDNTFSEGQFVLIIPRELSNEQTYVVDVM